MKPIIKNDDLKREREDFTARLNEQIDEPPIRISLQLFFNLAPKIWMHNFIIKERVRSRQAVNGATVKRHCHVTTDYY